MYDLQHDDEKIVSCAAHPDNTIRVWDLAAGKCQKVIHGHSHYVYCLQYDHEKIVRLHTCWGINYKTLNTYDQHLVTSRSAAQETRRSRFGTLTQAHAKRLCWSTHLLCGGFSLMKIKSSPPVLTTPSNYGFVVALL